MAYFKRAEFWHRTGRDGDGNRTMVQLRWELVPVLRKKEDWPEAAEHSRSRTRNQRRIDFLRSTGLVIFLSEYV